MNLRLLVPSVLAIVALITFSSVSPHFLDATYLLANSTLYVETGLLAVGMTFVIVSGNIDLSVGSNLVLTACLTAKLLASGVPAPLAVLASLLIGTTLGLINGVLVAQFNLPSFLVTLATMATYRGVAQAMLGPASVEVPPTFVGIDGQGIAGVPLPVVIFIVIAIAAALLMHKTVFGRWTFAVGTNEKAALFTGIPTTQVKLIVFSLAGLMAGVGALLLDSRLGVARHDLARGAELEAITMVVVGGASIAGGQGTILGTSLALVLFSIVKTGMGVTNIKAEYQLIATGILMVCAALLMNHKLQFRPKSVSSLATSEPSE